jgi:peptide chain release factor 2
VLTGNLREYGKRKANDMLEFEEYKSKLNNIRPALDALKDALKLEAAAKEIEELEKMSEMDGFWNDVEKSRKVQKRLKTLKDKTEKYKALCATWDDLMTICEMAIEENDASMLEELQSEYTAFEKELEATRLSTLLTGEYDGNNAILTFHAGAGGTEAQDWASMLYRMYNMWADRHGYKVKLMDYLDGDEAGLKSATIMIEGENAYGFLKSENGIHRLVRISPFDAAGRRHTSFAALEVMPEISDDSEIELRDEDIKMDVYRSSGAGGQKVNKTSSAVRLTHIPTGIVVASQVERSHFQNLENCKNMLRAKLAEIKEREHLEKISDIKGVQMKIEWGSQIRSYVFMPYQLVKDHRTDYEDGNIDNVMNGDLDGFINAYLSMKAAQ